MTKDEQAFWDGICIAAVREAFAAHFEHGVSAGNAFRSARDIALLADAALDERRKRPTTPSERG